MEACIPMTADFESALKEAWDRMATHPRCGEFCKKSPCMGHAALLEMVDAHCEEAACNRWSNDSMEHHELRRRLRATVGVDE